MGLALTWDPKWAAWRLLGGEEWGGWAGPAFHCNCWCSEPDVKLTSGLRGHITQLQATKCRIFAFPLFNFFGGMGGLGRKSVLLIFLSESHTWQAILGCELREDGSKGGFLHYGYDGMDFISFDKETFRWVTAQPQAQKVKEKWEDDSGWSQRNKVYLETCIEQLKSYLSYSKEALQRIGKDSDKVEVLICQAFGFYPKGIQAIWRRGEEDCKYGTLLRNVAPNSDGTYYVRLIIEIDPKERDLFNCHIKHGSLQEPLVLAWKENPEEKLQDWGW
uniref:Ig-like domain-containing protein n=1 Tax=Pseudonaja textilis TaxID=8673 RepID=A0A670YV24_PSETE